MGFGPVEASLYQDDENSNGNSSQEKSNGESEKKAKGMPGKKKEYKTIDEFIEDGEFVSMEGFMNILHETEKDKYYLVLDETQLNKEFIYPGTTRLIFSENGLIKEHRDYFDFYGPTFGPVPVLGSLIKWIYKRFVS